MTVFDILINYRDGLLAGLLVTLELAALVWAIGLCAGSVLAIASARWPKLIGLPLTGASFALSAVPVLVFLFWLHYPLQSMLNVVIDPFITAVVALSVLNTLAVSDLIRKVLQDFPKQYVVAAQVCGLTAGQTISHVYFPIVLRQSIPGLLILQVNMLQATLFASLISVDEIFRVVQRINAAEYRPVEIYTALAIFFLVICLPLNGFAIWLKHKYTRNLSER